MCLFFPPSVFYIADIGLFVCSQCPLNRTATPEEEGCGCVVGPPGQRGSPGRMVTCPRPSPHTLTHTTSSYKAQR